MKSMRFKKIVFTLTLSAFFATNHTLMAVKTAEDFYNELALPNMTEAEQLFCQELAKQQAEEVTAKGARAGQLIKQQTNKAKKNAPKAGQKPISRQLWETIVQQAEEEKRLKSAAQQTPSQPQINLGAATIAPDEMPKLRIPAAKRYVPVANRLPVQSPSQKGDLVLSRLPTDRSSYGNNEPDISLRGKH